MKSILSGLRKSFGSPRRAETGFGADLKWVFCGGMMRSGSTLQYNIAAEMVEHCGIGQREIWVDDHDGYFANASERGVVVFKSHELSSAIRDRLTNGQAVAIISFRDVRDVTASWQAKSRRPIGLAEGLRFAETAIKRLQPWEELPRDRIFVSKYEDVVGNLPGEVARMARWMGLHLDAREIQAISERVDMSAMARRLEGSGPDALTRTASSSWNTQTLVHTDHLNGGLIGRYKRELSPALTAELTQRHGDWLLAHGYDP